MKKILVLMMLFSANLYAESSAVQKLENFISKAKTLEARFIQKSLDEAGSTMQTSYGVFYLQQPGQFRWNYEKPYAQQIVSKDGKVWFYDADLEQVIVKKIDQSIGDTPALLLSGSVNLDEKYTITSQGQKLGLEWIKLTPKSLQSSFKYIMVGLKENVLYGMELSDNFGQLTQIIFSDVNVPAELAPGIFDFVAPAGTDVFDG